MRPIPIPPSIAAVVVLAAQYGGEQLSPPPSSSASRCDPHACVRRSSGGEIEANAAMILIVMSCALICALALKISICCSLRHSGSSSQLGQTQQHQKPNMHEEVQQPQSPTLVYSVGMRLAGEEAECAICLSEFVEGDGIRVLDRCKHGFHVHCVHQWLSSHSSCPTCRASCLPSLAVSDEESGATNHNSGPDRGVPDSV